MPDIYPLQVEINEQNIGRVIELFRGAYEQILGEINTATDFGVANRKAILAQVEVILEELTEQSNQLMADELPKYYSTGANEAVKQLKNIGAPIDVSQGFNQVHKEAIAALVDDASRAIAESIQGVGRSANLLLGRATRDAITQQIATGQIGGAALRKVRQQIKGVLAEQGLTALVDKGGRRWELDRYAEMVFRTKAVEGRNRGLINRLAENEYDLVQVSEHFGSCPLCAPWQGKILSITGSTPGYKTLAEAELAGLFHPNCRHALNALVPSLAKKTRAYDPKSRTLKAEGESIREGVTEALDRSVISPAQKYQAQFAKQVEKLAGAGGWQYSVGPVKKIDRSVDKVMFDYNANVFELKDANRAVIFISDPYNKSEFDKMVREVRGVFGNVERTKEGFGFTSGYKKNMINVKAPSGHIVEIQVTTQEMWEAKKQLGGDALYEKVREQVDGFEKYEQKMIKLYKEADAKTLARLGRSKP